MLKSLSHIQVFATSWTVALQAPLSMGFCRQEYWSGLPCLPPGDLPDPGVKSHSPALQADSLPSEPPGKPFKQVPGIAKWSPFTANTAWWATVHGVAMSRT